jgi:hypothetical protein|tara:strand:- start:10499 stop:10681 length:183 start_codon:yes stop_codon:yes gene_type:complete
MTESKDEVKKETKPADPSLAILERKKAPNRLVVGACARVAITICRRDARNPRRSTRRASD